MVGKGFNDLLHVMDSQYELPCRHTLMKMIPEKFKTLEKELQQQIDYTSHIAFTTDIWTSQQTVS